MQSIWTDDGSGWRLLNPASFDDEATLHTLVEQTPAILPLAGSPQLVILGREVNVGGGYADLVAVERTGRLAILEIKLAQNSESRRAVVAQVLTYAAYLRGLAVETLEGEVLRRHLAKLGVDSIEAAVAASSQEGDFDAVEFRKALEESVRTGQFRLVFVLDEAPSELVTLVGYLEAVTHELVIDLVAVTPFAVGDSRVLVPQRMDPERRRDDQFGQASRIVTKGYSSEG